MYIIVIIYIVIFIEGLNTLNSVSPLKGAQKAAALMLALNDEHSSKLFSMMEEEEIKEISVQMASLGNINSSLIEWLFVEFANQLTSTGSLTGTYQTTERLLGKALPEDQVLAIMEEIRGPAGRTMWEKLANVNETVLANYLRNEYPQTVAVVLSQIRPDHSARVISELPEDFAMEVITRMLHMESVQKEVLQSIESTLRAEFMANLSKSSRKDPHETMAEIFNAFDRSTETRFMNSLEEQFPDSSEKIKSLMFTFEDLKKIDPTSIQTLLRNVEKDQLARALKGASNEIKELFFSNMSERAAKILQEDMQVMGPVRLKEVDEVQLVIVNIAKDLSNRGEIFISDGNADDELLY